MSLHINLLLSNVINTTNTLKIPPTWLALPFIALLLMIATGPLFYPHFWHKNYAKIAVLCSLFVISYYIFILNNTVKPVDVFFEYIQFIALIGSLYMASGSILIKINKQGTALTNLILLMIGALLANLIGTTGASMLLIRPYLRLNTGRIQVYHILFFIFIVSNIGGALTPIGDPPLFLGFLSGVPFFWTLVHNSPPWCFALFALGIIFYLLDRNNHLSVQQIRQKKPTITITGQRHFIGLAIIIGAVFLDPKTLTWVPAIHYQGHQFSFLRELLMGVTAWMSYRYADKKALKDNAFNFEPIKEVVFIFIGIFGTMIPALELISALAQSEIGKSLITTDTLYWGTGICSSMLDNAPTYVNFSTASMASQGANIANLADVQSYAAGGIYTDSVVRLKAISIASVFFGAMTYIGNGPNFMVKAIAEQSGIKMPDFGSYILRFSIPFLLPVLLFVWLIFFKLT